jgi:thiol-disulfide isomerase/thioredoxin
MTDISRWLRLLMLLLLVSGSGAAGGALREFVPGSYQAILDARQGKPLILLFWSLDCPPCHRELSILGSMVAERPELPLVLVSTDGAGMGREVTALLKEKGLSAVESWLYADDFAQRLRFEVDRNWYGELPRSYLFDGAHNRRATSGVFDEGTLRSWLLEQGSY